MIRYSLAKIHYGLWAIMDNLKKDWWFDHNGIAVMKYQKAKDQYDLLNQEERKKEESK